MKTHARAAESDRNVPGRSVEKGGEGDEAIDCAIDGSEKKMISVSPSFCSLLFTLRPRYCVSSAYQGAARMLAPLQSGKEKHQKCPP